MIFLNIVFFIVLKQKKIGAAYLSLADLLIFWEKLRGDFPKFSQIVLELISRTFSARFHLHTIMLIIYRDIFYLYIMQYSINLMWFVIFVNEYSVFDHWEESLMFLFYVTLFIFVAIIYLVILIFITCEHIFHFLG